MWTSTRIIVAKYKKSITQFIIKKVAVGLKYPVTSKMFYDVDWKNTFLQERLQKNLHLNKRVLIFFDKFLKSKFSLAHLPCENIRFSSLFAAGDVVWRNVPSGEERGESDVFAGYGTLVPKLITKLTGSCVKPLDINSGTEKRDFMRAYPFHRVANIVASKCDISYWHVPVWELEAEYF